MKGTYTLKPNTQIMLVSSPGEIGIVRPKSLPAFLTDAWYRQKTYEPLFDMHSISDLNEKNATYRYSESYERIGPFTNTGLSLFESPLRAKEGSLIPNSVLHVGIPGDKLSQLYGIYVFSTDSTQPVDFYNFDAIRDTLGLPMAQRYLYLSDAFGYLEKAGMYDHAIGLGVIQMSCNTFYSMKNGNKRLITPFDIWTDTGTINACVAAESMYHIADSEYRSLDLLDSKELDEKYPSGIVLPVFVDEKRGVGKNEGGPLIAMMDLVE